MCVCVCVCVCVKERERERERERESDEWIDWRKEKRNSIYVKFEMKTRYK